MICICMFLYSKTLMMDQRKHSTIGLAINILSTEGVGIDMYVITEKLTAYIGGHDLPIRYFILLKVIQ